MGRVLQYKLSNLIYQSFWISDDMNPYQDLRSSFSPEGLVNIKNLKKPIMIISTVSFEGRKYD